MGRAYARSYAFTINNIRNYLRVVHTTARFGLVLDVSAIPRDWSRALGSGLARGVAGTDPVPEAPALSQALLQALASGCAPGAGAVARCPCGTPSGASEHSLLKQLTHHA